MPSTKLWQLGGSNPEIYVKEQARSNQLHKPIFDRKANTTSEAICMMTKDSSKSKDYKAVEHSLKRSTYIHMCYLHNHLNRYVHANWTIQACEAAANTCLIKQVKKAVVLNISHVLTILMKQNLVMTLAHTCFLGRTYISRQTNRNQYLTSLLS